MALSGEYVEFEIAHDTGLNVAEYVQGRPALPIPIVSRDDFTDAIGDLSGESKPAVLDEELAEDWADSEALMDGPDGQIQQGDPTVYPMSAVGKLITSKGQCSGALVHWDLMLTAAHCLHSGRGGTPYRNVLFQPAHPTHGVWYRVTHVRMPKYWIDRRSFAHDVAICKTEPMDVPSWFGVRLMPSHVRPSYRVYGYPVAGFGGMNPYIDRGISTYEPFKQGDLTFRESVFAADRIDMTPGSSGGPWTTDAHNHNVLLDGHVAGGGGSQAAHKIAGLNSFMFSSHPGMMITPQFSGFLSAFWPRALNGWFV